MYEETNSTFGDGRCQFAEPVRLSVALNASRITPIYRQRHGRTSGGGVELALQLPHFEVGVASVFQEFEKNS